ncbi:trypsin-like peptidase domain-containing protein [bacterium]|nr:trypsin-like peptidase domain-containing protein [bacterium]
MRLIGIIAVLGLLFTGVGLPQDDFPAVRVAAMAADRVVSIDAHNVALISVAGFGLTEARQSRLLTNRLTGFVYTENGYIITDSRDIEDATLLSIKIGEGMEMEAEVIGTDAEYGVGVLKVDCETPLTPVQLLEEIYDPLAEVYPYDQGDPVIAIGYSGGYGGTVTFGIISAIRNFRNRNGILLPSVIQADVVINAGNEGCPLFNEDGVVIAMHDRRGGGGGLQGITFFTPIWLIKRVADEIIACYESDNVDECEVWHPWLGVKTFSGSMSPFGGIREVTDDLKMYMNIPDQYWNVGILLDKVYAGSPASEHGLMNKDMLISLTILDGDENVKQDFMYLESIEELELLVTTAEREDMFVFNVLKISSGLVTLITREVTVGDHPGAFSFIAPDPLLAFEDSSDYF